MNPIRSQHIAVLVTVMGLHSVSASTIFSDSAFAPGDWTLTVFSLGSGGTVNANQETSGGTPGAYRRVVNTVNSGLPNSAVLGFHKKQGAVYTPALQGPILRIDYEEDSLMSAGFDEGQGGAPALQQGSEVYVGPGFITPDLFWTHKVVRGIGASDFLRIDIASPNGVDPVSHPDFSTNGSPISFGFIRSNSTASGGVGYIIDGGIDNWSLGINLPIVLTIRLASVELCWNSVVNGMYEVQFRSDLTTNLWTTFTNMTATATTTCIFDGVPTGQPQRFYRVEQK